MAVSTTSSLVRTAMNRALLPRGSPAGGATVLRQRHFTLTPSRVGWSVTETHGRTLTRSRVVGPNAIVGNDRRLRRGPRGAVARANASSAPAGEAEEDTTVASSSSSASTSATAVDSPSDPSSDASASVSTMSTAFTSDAVPAVADAGPIPARFTEPASGGLGGSADGTGRDERAATIGVFSTGAVLVPHPDKADKGGEDACFVLRDQGAFGVMDGVGGWAEEGVDPAAYSNTFAEKSAAAVLMGKTDPRAVIAEAHANTQIVGSSTACVAVLESKAGVDRLLIGNLGDAGAMVARGSEVVFSTPPQQHEFNCPYQLGWKEFYPESDTAEDAETYSVDVLAGDCLIMGTDGLWDNVPALEAAEVMAALVKEGKDAQEVAEAIATVAFEHSVDEEYDSPFTQEARRNGYDVEWWEKAQGKTLVGGKMDDIAVIVAFLDEKSKCPAPLAEEEEEEEETETTVEETTEKAA